MCNAWCLEFARLALSHIGENAKILEVGSRDVNGTTKEVLSRRAREYIGIDIFEGRGVDKILDVKALTNSFDVQSFNVVTSTEMLEHCDDWQWALFQMVAVLKIGGILLITTRSPGFELHDYPKDYWRFSAADFEKIFSPIGDIIALQSDMTGGWPCGIGIILRRTAPQNILESWNDVLEKMTVYSMMEEVRTFNQPDNTTVSDIIFDQYSRYRACSKMIETISPVGSILDVGSGPHCLLGKFLPDRAITYVDPLLANGINNVECVGYSVFDEKLDGKKFDYVCSVDTLEHVPEEVRDDFLKRISDLATKGVVLGFPCSDDDTAFRTDKIIDDSYRRAYGKSYFWLEEHFRFTLPRRKHVVSLLQELGWTTTYQVGHGHAPWLGTLLSEVICGLEIPDAHSNILRVSKKFNIELYQYDFNPPFYRWFVIAVKKPFLSLPLKLGPSIDEIAEKRFKEILGEAHSGLFYAFQNAVIERDMAESRRHAEKIDRRAVMEKLKAAEAAADTMVNSKSWRITRPLRTMARFFRHKKF
jgi:SAM-dependent methyltransferase